jgi:hypothetical protein
MCPAREHRFDATLRVHLTWRLSRLPEALPLNAAAMPHAESGNWLEWVATTSRLELSNQ